MKKFLAFTIAFFAVAFSANAQEGKFTNPLLPSGPDPYSTYHDGYYYYTSTKGNRLVLLKTKNLADLKNAERKTIWTPPAGKRYSKDVWAPEVQLLDGKWYFYFAADDGSNENHRMYILENPSPDPFKGEWTLKGKLATPSDKWAIDGNIYRYKDQLYMIWSGWQGDVNGEQDVFIAKMKNPYTMDGDRSMIGAPEFDWETHGTLGEGKNKEQVNVNEGPQFLEHEGRLFIVYSASGCWTDYYALGLLELKEGADPMVKDSWIKSKEPILKQSKENQVYATGHNSFFKSPDGTEDWILYHANAKPGQGCGRERSPRMQRVYWREDGTPYIGLPVPAGVLLDLPSGTEL